MAKYSYEFKKKVVQAYLNGEGGYTHLAEKYDVKNKHGRTLEEYHADIRSADSVGSKVAKTALSDLEKINRKDAKKNNANCGENTKEMIARRKVIGQNAKMRANESLKK